jgi:hypothetical protein
MALNSMIDFLNAYDNSDLHVGSAISQKKLQSSFKAHGVDPRDEVWAVIDSTLMGSAENGMSLTRSGIYWKNMWAVKTRLNRYTWDELAKIAPRMEAGGGNVKFEPGVEFSTPATFKPEHVLNMLQAMVGLYLEQVARSTPEVARAADEPRSQPTVALAHSNDTEHYAQTLGRYLAVVACHCGIADETCVAIATELLEEEEIGAPGVLAAFAETIDRIEKEHRRSATFFKLAQAKVLAEVRQLPQDQEDRIRIMCEALKEATGSGTAEDAFSKVDTVLQR